MHSKASASKLLALASIDNVSVIINYCLLISSAMRRSSRWSQGGVAAILSGGDIFRKTLAPNENSLALPGNQTGPGSGGYSLGPTPSSQGSDDNPLYSTFLQLKAILVERSAENLDVDLLTVLQPFLLTIKSPLTNGAITGLALDAIAKFISYGLISTDSPRVHTLCVSIVSALTHCRFEAADQNSDDSVSFKVLRLLERLMVSEFINYIPNSSVSEVVQTCLLVTCNKKRSEVLRRAAEMVLRNITESIFAMVSQLPPDSADANDLPLNFDNATLAIDPMGGDASNEVSMTLDNTTLNDLPQNLENANLNDPTQTVGNALSTDAIDGDASSQRPAAESVFDKHTLASSRQSLESEAPKNGDSDSDQEERFGVACIHEYLGILVSIIAPCNLHQHMESTRVFALDLITTALEVAGDYIPQHACLLGLVADPISKHILQIITTTDSPVLLRAALQVFSTMLVVMPQHLKSQLELSITLALNSILPQDTSNANDTIKGASNLNRTPLAKEMIMELLSLLWARSLEFFVRLFIDYDCDFDRSDLAIKVIETLCSLSLPAFSAGLTDAMPSMCLDSIMSFVSGVNARTKFATETSSSEPHILLQNKAKKTCFTSCTSTLNENPKAGISALVENGFLKDPSNTTELASFFFNKSGRLNKKVLGEFLAKPSNTVLLQEFIDLFEFSNLRVDEALRIMLKTFRLPGESQQIERVVELFSKRYVACQEKLNNHRDSDPTREQVRPSQDAVFVLLYSIIMLNTDLHNPHVKKQMLLDDYARNLRGVYNGKNFPTWYLSKIYNSIKDREIIMPEEHHGTDKWFDDVWHNLISSLLQLLRIEDSNTALTAAQICEFDRVLFEGVIDTIIATHIKVFESSTDDHVISRLMSSIDKCGNICLFYHMDAAVDKLLALLCDLTMLGLKNAKQQRIDDVNGGGSSNTIAMPLTQITIDTRDEPIVLGETAVWFGRDFKAQLSLVVLFRLCRKSGCRVMPLWKYVIRIILVLFENCLLEPNLFRDFQNKIRMVKIAAVKPLHVIKRVKPMNNTSFLSTFLSFLKSYSDDSPEPTDLEIESALSTIDCVHLVHIPSIFEGVSKTLAENLCAFVKLLIASVPDFSESSKNFYESEISFIVEIAVCFCLLLNDQLLIDEVYAKLAFAHLSNEAALRILTYKVLLIRRSGVPANVHSLVEEISRFNKEVVCKHGSHLLQPLLSLVDDEFPMCGALLESEHYWRVLRFFVNDDVNARDIVSFVQSLSKDSLRLITPQNSTFILGLLDEVSSVGAVVPLPPKNSTQMPFSEQETARFDGLIELSKDSITTTVLLLQACDNSKIFLSDPTFPIVQAIAHQCFNPCRTIRDFATKNLTQVIITLDITNEGSSPVGVFDYGLLPLLLEIFKPEVRQTDVPGFHDTQLKVLSLFCKALLKFFNSMRSENVERIWISGLEFFNSFKVSISEMDAEKAQVSLEFIVEMIKNVVLVLRESREVAPQSLWDLSWQKLQPSFPELEQVFAKISEPETPAAAEPEPAEPVSAAIEPSVSEPAVSEPSVSEPIPSEPIPSEPIPSDSAVAEPSVSEPTPIEPSVSESPNNTKDASK